MKKKYFAPEMEELKVEEPVVLDMQDGTQVNIGGCPSKGCDPDNCPGDSD